MGPHPAWLRAAFESLSEVLQLYHSCARRRHNLAIVGLELVSGVLREGTVAVSCNSTLNPARNVMVKGLADDITVDNKTIPDRTGIF